MKSAADYPEYQGDPDNIQFLTRNEHLEAHKGSWQNTTNWYYNPETKEFVDFGENKPTPCEIIKLSDPVVCLSDATQASSKTTKSNLNKGVEINNGEKQQKDNSGVKRPSESVPTTVKHTSKFKKSIKWINNKIIGATKFFERPPRVKGLKNALGVVVGVGVVGGISALVTNAKARSGKGSVGGFGASSLDDIISNCFSDDECTDYSDVDDYDDSPSDRDYPDERSSPKEHTVQSHGQRYHTNDGVIWKEKKSFQRGGKHVDNLE